jgi:hypothetical protein
MSGQTIVDRIYGDFLAVAEILTDKLEPSLLTSADGNFRKSLLMTAASYFEARLTNDVFEFSKEISNGDSLITSLIRNKAILRQYHTWFDWKARNANTFFSMFGEEMKLYMKRNIESNDSLRISIEDFMEIGRDRNRLAHDNYGTVSLEKTSAEIYSVYKSANSFVEFIPTALRGCSNEIRDRDSENVGDNIGWGGEA